MAYNVVLQLQLQGPSPGNVLGVVSGIQKQLRGAGLNVNVNTNQATAGMQRLSAGAKSTQAALGGVKNQAAALNATLSATVKLGSQGVNIFGAFAAQAGLAARRFLAFTIAAGSFIRLVQGIKDGVRSAIEFDLQMNRLAQVAGDGATRIGQVRNEINRLSTSLGVSANELANVAVTFRQAGLAAKDLSSALRAVALTDLAPNFDDMKQTTEGLIATWRQFGIQARDFENVLGSINAVAGAFAVEASDIVTAIQKAGGSFAAVAGQVKPGIEALAEFQGLFTSVRATTRESADTIATGLRTIFTRLQRRETVEALKDLRVNLRFTRDEALALGDINLTDQFVGAFEAVTRLSEGLRGLRETDPRFSSIIEQLGGFRQISKVIPLIKQHADAQKAVNVALAGQISLQVAAEKRQEAIATKINKVREEYGKLFRDFVSSDSFATLADTLLKIANSFARVIDAIQPLIPVLGAFLTFKAVGSIGSIFRNFVGNIANAPGAPIKRFARGGVVPGHGNTDSVPAQLMPQEFVIRKSSAQKIGYSTLHEMNQTGRVPFATGGQARLAQVDVPKPGFVGMFYLNRDTKAKKLVRVVVPISGFDKGTKEYKVVTGVGLPSQESKETIEAAKEEFATKYAKTSTPPKIPERYYDIPGKITVLPEHRTLGHHQSAFIKWRLHQGVKKFGREKGARHHEGVAVNLNAYGIGHRYQGKVQDGFKKSIKSAIKNMAIEVFGPLVKKIGGALPTDDARLDSIYDHTITHQGQGRIFESLLQYVGGNAPSSSTANFDLEPKIDPRIAGIFAAPSDIFADVKLADNTSSRANTAKKAVREFGFKRDARTGRARTTELNKALNSRTRGLTIGASKDSFISNLETGLGTEKKFEFTEEELQKLDKVYEENRNPNQKPRKKALGGLIGFAEGGSNRRRRYTPTISDVKKMLGTFHRETGIDFSKFVKNIRIVNTKDPRHADSRLVKHDKKYDDETQGVFYSQAGKNYIELNSAAISSYQDLRAALAHELGHAADKFLGGKKFASQQRGSAASEYGGRFSRRLRFRDYSNLTFRNREDRNYYYSREEGFAELFSSYLNRDSSTISRLGRRGFERRVIEELARKTNPNYKPRDYVADRPGFVGRIARFFGFNKGGENHLEDSVPALLTPGEYVFNRRAAAQIGLPALETMNRTGKLPRGYNTGGFVQKFANAGEVEKFLPTNPTIKDNPEIIAEIEKLGKSLDELIKTGTKVIVRITDAVEGTTVKFVRLEPPEVKEKKATQKGKPETPRERVAAAARRVKEERVAPGKAFAELETEEIISGLSPEQQQKYAEHQEKETVDRAIKGTKRQDPSGQLKNAGERSLAIAMATAQTEEELAKSPVSFIQRGLPSISKKARPLDEEAIARAASREQTPAEIVADADLEEEFKKGKIGAEEMRKLGYSIESSEAVEEKKKRSRGGKGPPKKPPAPPEATPPEGDAGEPDEPSRKRSRRKADGASEIDALRKALAGLAKEVENLTKKMSKAAAPEGGTRQRRRRSGGKSVISDPSKLLGYNPDLDLDSVNQPRSFVQDTGGPRGDDFSVSTADFQGDDAEQYRYQQKLQKISGRPQGAPSRPPEKLDEIEQRLLSEVKSGKLSSKDAAIQFSNFVGKEDESTIQGNAVSTQARQAAFAARLDKAAGLETLGGAKIDERGFVTGTGTLAGRAQKAADEEIKRRGGVVSDQTKGELQRESLNREKAKITRELLNAERKLLDQTLKNTSSREKDRIARENVVKALEGEIKVVRDSQGKLLGTEASVNRARAQGITPTGAGGFLYQAGNVIGRASDAVSSKIASANAYLRDSALGQRLSSAGAGLLFAAPLLSQAFEPEGGARGVIQSGGNEGFFGYGGLRGLGSSLTSATLFASFGGSVLGPLGAAAGAAIGGLKGFMDGLREAEKEIRQIKIEEALNKFSENLRKIGESGLSGASAEVSRQSLRELNEARSEREAENRESARRTFLGIGFGVDEEKFAKLQSKSDRDLFNAQLPDLLSALQKEAERIGKANVGGSLEELSQNLRNGNNGLNRAFLEIVANVRVISIAKALEELQKNILAGQRQARAEREALASRELSEGAVNNFRRLTNATQLASDSLFQLQQRSQLLADIFEGNLNSSRVSFGVEGLSSLGRLDRAALRPLDILARVGGPIGQDLRKAGGQIDDVSRVLPGLIVEAIRTIPADNPEFGITEGVARQLRERGTDERLVALISRQLSEEASEGRGGNANLINQVKIDVSELTKRVLQPFADPIKEIAGQAAKELEASTQRLIDGLTQTASKIQQIGEGYDRLVELQTSNYRAALEISARRAGRPNQALDFAPLEVLNRPFTSRQLRLASFGGLRGDAAFDSNAITEQFFLVSRELQIAEANQQRVAEKTGGRGPEFENAAKAVINLRVSAINLQRALQNLADASGRTAAAQEQLARLNQEESSRLSFGERLLTADPEELTRINRGLLLANAANNRGNLDGFTPQDRKLILETLRSASGVTLTGFRGQPKAEDLANTLVRNSLGGAFGLNPEQANQRKKLEDTILQGLKAAEEASKNLIKTQEATVNDFYQQQLQLQQQFFAKLEATLARERLIEVTNRSASATVRQQELDALNKSKNTLAQLGITDDEQLGNLLRRRGDLQRFFETIKAEDQTRKDERAIIDSLGRPDSREAITQEIGKFTSATDALRPDNARQIVRQMLGGFTEQLTTKEIEDIANQFDISLRINSGKFKEQNNLESFFGSARNTHEITDKIRGFYDELLNNTLADFFSKQRTEIRRRRQGVLGDLGNIEGFRVENLSRFSEKDVLDALKAFEGSERTLKSLPDDIRTTNDELERFKRQISELQAIISRGESVSFTATGAARGAIPAFKASGGRIPMGGADHGQGRDQIPAWLAPGEFVVNAESTRSNLPLLQRINNTRGPLRMANGGITPERERIVQAVLKNPRAFGITGIALPGLKDFDARVDEVVERLRTKNFREHIVNAITNNPRAFGVNTIPLRGFTEFDRQVEAAADKFILRLQAGNQYNTLLERERIINAVQRNPRAFGVKGIALRGIKSFDAQAGAIADRYIARQNFVSSIRNFNRRAALSAGETRPGAEGQRSVFANILQGEQQRQSEFARSGFSLNQYLDQQNRARFIKQGILLPGGFNFHREVLGNIGRFATGGLVTGPDQSRDSVLAMVQPGEFVLRRGAVQQLGLQNVQRFNEGGLVGGGAQTASIAEAASQLSQAFSVFAGNANTLANALNNMPRQITFEGRLTHDININGAEALSRLTPELKGIVIDEVKNILRRAFKNSLPDAGIQID